MKRLLLSLVALMALASLAAPLSAQGAAPSEPLERFVLHVARLWAAGDAAALVDLAPADSRIVLDIGDSRGAVQSRHAAAALRSLFADRETAGIRPTRVTLSGGSPARGFGELAWTSRSRGMSDAETVTLYVGTVWDGRGWRIRELRILR
jgi:hypothetical protein